MDIAAIKAYCFQRFGAEPTSISPLRDGAVLEFDGLESKIIKKEDLGAWEDSETKPKVKELDVWEWYIRANEMRNAIQAHVEMTLKCNVKSVLTIGYGTTALVQLTNGMEVTVNKDQLIDLPVEEKLRILTPKLLQVIDQFYRGRVMAAMKAKYPDIEVSKNLQDYKITTTDDCVLVDDVGSITIKELLAGSIMDREGESNAIKQDIQPRAYDTKHD